MLGTFLDNLFASGEVVVLPAPLPADGVFDQGTEEVLRVEYARRCAECPGIPPRYEGAAALAGARLLYNGCVCLVNRALDETEVQTALIFPLPADDAGSRFSLDLTLAHLPALLRMAEGAAPGDPLVIRLRELAAALPLSSVGVRGLETLADETTVLAHPALRRLYADRVIECRDDSRLRNPEALAAVQESLGTHNNLWPGLSERLEARRTDADHG